MALGRAAMAGLLIVAAGCGGDDDDLDAASDTSSTASTSAAGVSPPSLVGHWTGVHDCAAIVAALRAAGAPETVVVENIVGNGLVLEGSPDELASAEDPCAEAVPREHGHFFTESGEFGSTDFNGDQVDDGTYEIIDDDTVRINGTEFGYVLDGDDLTLTPPEASDCSNFECQWSIVVAMPGQTLHREP